MDANAPAQPPARLRRELGVFGAVMLGLGSIVGTGVFVSLGVAAGVAGPAVLLAIVVGAAVASFNGFSSAQLAADHPVSGGTYEYGYRYLRPWLGFLAGVTFLLAKSASAATAALGFAGYLLGLVGAPARWSVPVAVAAVAALTAVVLAGMRRSNAVNVAVVAVTLLSLLAFVVAGAPAALAHGAANLVPFFAPEAGSSPLAALLRASALMFVAFTGYGRIATLGEEVVEPRRTIPRAVVAALLVVMVLYGLVGLVGVGAVGADGLARVEGRAAPLELAARAFGAPGVARFVAVGAVTAMLGVALNLVLGLSRVLLAMGRRGDAPRAFGRLDAAGTTPTAAVLAVGVLVALLALVGDVRTTWSFSAFTVLVYYAVTNLAALALPADARTFPRWTAWLGLAGCLGLA
ncbi:MAG TPA: APC family permease, partial [Trueperaceae bacterium]|nr:APC family permease [Trueperaceae bacterium]